MADTRVNDTGDRKHIATSARRRGLDLPLGRLLAQVERQLTHQVEAVLAAAGLTVDQWRVLDVLADGQGHTMSEIAAAIVVPGPTLTKIVDRLVDAAAVYRLVDARDRRRVLAFLSDSGRDLHAQLRPDVAAAEADAVSVLGADADLLLALLARLAARPGRTDGPEAVGAPGE